MDIDELDYKTKLKSLYKTESSNYKKRLYQLLEMIDLPFVKRDKNAYFFVTRNLTLAYSSIDHDAAAYDLIVERMKHIGWDVSKYRFTKDYLFPSYDEVEVFESIPIKDAEEILILGCFEGMSTMYFLDKLIDKPKFVDLVDITKYDNLEYNISDKPFITFYEQKSQDFQFNKMYDFIHINGSADDLDFTEDLLNSIDYTRKGGIILVSYMGVKGYRLRNIAEEIIEARNREVETLNTLGQYSRYLIIRKVD